MLLKKHLWMIFYILVGISSIYLISLNFSYWDDLKNKTNAELNSINSIFSASVESVFSQQEIVLELLGQQLYRNDFYKDTSKSTQVLDTIIESNESLVAFGLVGVDGEIILASSNVNLDKMPNLRTAPKSKKSFLNALSSPNLSIGRTYFIEALNSYAIPMRKAIRNENGVILGVMTAGIKPSNLLLGLEKLSSKAINSNLSSLVVQDETFYRLYLTQTKGISNAGLIGEKVPVSLFLEHQKSLLQQAGVTIEELKQAKTPVGYSSKSNQGEIQFSIMYIPRFKLWSFIAKPKAIMQREFDQFKMKSIFVFLIIALVLFVLFRSLNIASEDSRKNLLQQANHDFLTGLFNRQYLKFIEHSWTDDKSKKFSVLFIDLDNFKNINDHYGHNIGDVILKIVADRLQRVFASSNLICRQGGDEFIVLYRDNNGDLTKEIADRVIKKIVKPYQINKYEFVIGASMGISKFPLDGDNFDSLFSAADTAMYSAKGKNINYKYFTQELSVKTAHTANIEQALHYALQKNEIYMVYQPQIKRNKQVYGVEALVRWESEVLGFMPPDQFIAIAENSGLIIEIGEYILRQSIADLSQLEKSLDRDDIQLSINISVRQFLESNFLTTLTSLLKEFKFKPSSLTLEITESIFIDDYDYIIPVFQKIRELGIKISLDDFGTGFSSLSMLKKLPINELKIDKSFIDLIVDNESDRTMVVNILNIARSLNLKVVAEGIEDSEQAEILDQHLCDVQQGYFYSKPAKLDGLMAFLKDYKPELVT